MPRSVYTRPSTANPRIKLKRSCSVTKFSRQSAESLDDIKNDNVKQIYEKYISSGDSARVTQDYVRNRIINTIVSRRLYQKEDIDIVVNEEKAAHPEISTSFFTNIVDQIFKSNNTPH